MAGCVILDEALKPYRGTMVDIGTFAHRHWNLVVFHRGERPDLSLARGTRYVDMTQGEDFHSGPERVDGVILAARGPFTPKERRYLARFAWPLVLRHESNGLLWIQI